EIRIKNNKYDAFKYSQEPAEIENLFRNYSINELQQNKIRLKMNEYYFSKDKIIKNNKDRDKISKKERFVSIIEKAEKFINKKKVKKFIDKFEPSKKSNHKILE
ncbi:16786_t:CDS:2, partial [Racocetra persica]